MSSGNSCSFSMPQNQEKKQIHRYALRIKIMHLCCWFAKHAQNFYCLTQRHRWRPRVFCLWGDRDVHMETTNRPSRPDRLEIFWNDWGDRDDHMETRLKYTRPGGSTDRDDRIKAKSKLKKILGPKFPNFRAVKFPESTKWYNYHKSSDCFGYPQKVPT